MRPGPALSLDPSLDEDPTDSPNTDTSCYYGPNSNTYQMSLTLNLIHVEEYSMTGDDFIVGAGLIRVTIKVRVGVRVGVMLRAKVRVRVRIRVGVLGLGIGC